MKAKIKLFIPLVLICSLLIGSTCFASSGRGSAYIFGDSSLNSEVIRQFNSMSNKEQSDLVRSISPLLFNRLGFIMNDPYTTINTYWQLQKNRRVNEFSSAGNYFQNTTDEYPYTFVYLNDGEYYWYDELVDYLRNTMTTLGGQLVMNDTSGINYILNSYVDYYADSMGVQTVKLYSYKNINSSNFSNLTQYNKFIAFCDDAKYKGYNYVICVKDYDDAKWYCALKGNLYRRSATGQFGLCSDSGTVNLPEYWYRDSNSSSGTGTVTNDGSNYYELGAPSIVFYKSWYTGLFPTTYWTFNGGTQKGSYLFSLTDDVQNFKVFTSLSAWINAHGHFEYPFHTTNFFGRVPSVNVTSQDMTNVYNQIFTDNSNNSVNTNTVTNIYYPDSYVPDSNSYDKDSHKLDFSGVGALLSSIGDLIGSLINGIAQGIANIVSSIASVVHNLVDVFTSGNVFAFLKVFMSWLPEPIPTLLISFFTLSVLFAVIKLVKGVLS